MTKPDQPESGQSFEETKSSASRFLTTRCVACQCKFGFKQKAIGKELACPKCGKRQVVGQGTLTSEKGSDEPQETVERPRDADDGPTPTGERRRGQDKSAMKQLLVSLAGSVSVEERERLQALLPPRYAAAGDEAGVESNKEARQSEPFSPNDARSATIRQSEKAAGKPPGDQGQFAVLANYEAAPVRVPRALQINTESSAVEFKGSRVPVKAVSRDAKEFRRRLRVGIVFGFSALVLIALFWFLINRAASGG